jgi:hypothetical protein
MMQLTLTRSQLATFDFVRTLGGMNTPSSEDLQRTLADLSPVLGSALVIGGMAIVHHGYERSTKDIDILYANRDEADLLRRLKKSFKIVRKAQSGWHHFEHKKTKVRLELIPEGGLTNYGLIPGPKTVGGQNGFISLLGLVWLKLVSGRLQDTGDLGVLAKLHMPRMRALAEKLPVELHGRYVEILDQAQRELDSDPNIHDRPRDGGESVKEAPASYGKKKRTSLRAAKTLKR